MMRDRTGTTVSVSLSDVLIVCAYERDPFWPLKLVVMPRIKFARMAHEGLGRNRCENVSQQNDV